MLLFTGRHKLLLISFLVFVGFGFIARGAGATEVQRESITLSMDEYMEQYPINYKDDKLVTVEIASREDFLNLRERIVESNKFGMPQIGQRNAVVFRQVANISLSDYEYRYQEASGRVGIYLGDTLQATIDGEGKFYSGFYTKREVDVDSLSLQGAILDPLLTETGSSVCHFVGNYDGNGYSISNFCVVSPKYCAGLFGTIFSDSKAYAIKDVTVTNSCCIGGEGGFLGTDNIGYIENCTVKDSFCIIGKEGDYFGGITGWNQGEIRNCQVDNLQIYLENAASSIVGGIAGYITKGLITDCTIKGFDFESMQRGTVGGIAGRVISNSSSVIISDCSSEGSLTINQSQLCVGGIVGLSKREAFCDTQIVRCVNGMDIKGELQTCGGICGEAQGGSFANCVNEGNLLIAYKMENDVGGLIGSITDFSNTTIENSYNQGNVIGQNAGGIVGDIKAVERQCKWIENCVNFGSVYGGSYGEIAGKAMAGEFANCFYKEGECNGSGVGKDSSWSIIEMQNICQKISAEEMSELKDRLNQWVSQCNGEINKSYYIMWLDSDIKCHPVLGIESDRVAQRIDAQVATWMELDKPEPTAQPPVSPTETPTVKPSVSPAEVPTVSPTVSPTGAPTDKPTASPTGVPTDKPTASPTGVPTISPTKKPATNPILVPTLKPTVKPGQQPQDTSLKTPKIKVSKGRISSKKKYLQIKFKSYQGKYAEIWLGRTKTNMKSINLSNSNIKKLKKCFRMTYRTGGVTMFVKVRTYEKNKGKKRYSPFTKVKKIRL